MWVSSEGCKVCHYCSYIYGISKPNTNGFFSEDISKNILTRQLLLMFCIITHYVWYNTGVLRYIYFNVYSIIYLCKLNVLHIVFVIYLFSY